MFLVGVILFQKYMPSKKNDTDGWSAYGSIGGFEHEKGYEYKLKVSETSYLDYSMGDEGELHLFYAVSLYAMS